MADQLRSCERCGEPAPVVGALGVCSRCLLTLALDPPDDVFETMASSAVPELDVSEVGIGARVLTVARYRVLRVIGEGGMATVYEAEQDHPRRTVALKILRPGLSNPKLLRRFEQESQALGRLQHPGIAQIFEAGTADTGFGPQPYFAMELIRGRTLDAHADVCGLTPPQRLELVARIAEAVHHAHQRGVIHRDLKPGNIIVDESGQPKVLDFGIARATDSDTRATSQTDVGQLLGTLTYMSPEQTLADPLEIDIRSDVYALGVILYELLAGRLPYTAARTLPDTVRAIRDEEPVRLGLVDRRFRGDVETIVATALEKDRTRRYGSAVELAADIRRHLADQPIVARPPTTAYQLRKFARRHRALVSSAAAVLLVLLAGVITSVWQAAEAARERDRAMAAEATATAQRNAALDAEQLATRERDRALAAETMLRQERDRALTAESDARDERDRARLAQAAADEERRRAGVAEAAAAAQRDATLAAELQAARERTRALAADSLIREDREQGIWQNLARESIRLSGTHVDDDLMALLARQAFLLAARASNRVRSMLVEDALQHAGRTASWSHALSLSSESGIVAAAFSRDGTQLATNGSDGSMEVWNLTRLTEPPRLLKGRLGQGTMLFSAFSPDGLRLATGGFESSGARGGPAVPAPVRIWDLRDLSRPPLLLHGHSREVVAGAFSPDGTQLVTTDSQSILMWDMRQPAPPSRVLQPSVAEPKGPTASTRFLSFSPDGTQLATRDDDGVRLWDVRRPTRPAAVLQDSRGVLRMAFSPDGALLAASCINGVRIWNLRSPGAPRVLVQLTEAQGGAVVFSPDGARLAATIPQGSAVHVWDLADPTSTPLILRGHERPALPLAFSPDGSRLMSAGMDRVVRIWELRPAGVPLLLSSETTILSFAFSPDGSRLYGGNGVGRVTHWSLRSDGVQPTQTRNDGGQPAGRRGATGSQVSNADEMRVLETRATTGTRALSTRRYSADGQQLAEGGIETDVVRVTDLRSRTTRSLPVRRAPGNTLVLYSPDGTRLAAVNRLEVRVWDARRPDSAPLVLALPADARDVTSMAFSMDNSRLAAGMENVQVYDLRDPERPPLVLRGAAGTTFYSLAFSPDGELLAGGNLSGATHLWDIGRPTVAAVLLPGRAAIAATLFSPDGLRLATGASDGSVRLWPLASAAADYLCTRVWRNLSRDEWRTYIGDSVPYERTCSALPSGAGAAEAR